MLHAKGRCICEQAADGSSESCGMGKNISEEGRPRRQSAIWLCHVDGSWKNIKRINECVVVGVRVSTRGTAFARTIFTFTDEKFDQYKRSGYLKAHT